MKCEEAMDKITIFNLNSLFDDKDKEIEEGVIEHVAKCPSCIEEMDAMSTLLIGENSALKKRWEELVRSEYEELCEEYSDMLPQYVEDIVQKGEPYAKEKYSLLYEHIQSCFSCQKNYTELKEMIETYPYPAKATAYVTPKKWQLAFPTLGILLDKLGNLMEQALGENLLFVKEVDLQGGMVALNQGFRKCAGFVQRTFGGDEIVKAEEELIDAIEKLIKQQDFPEDKVKIALSLANALGKDYTRLDKAKIDLKKQLLLDKKSIEIRLLLAFCYYKSMEQDKAEEQIQKAIRQLKESKD